MEALQGHHSLEHGPALSACGFARRWHPTLQRSLVRRHRRAHKPRRFMCSPCTPRAILGSSSLFSLLINSYLHRYATPTPKEKGDKKISDRLRAVPEPPVFLSHVGCGSGPTFKVNLVYTGTRARGLASDPALLLFVSMHRHALTARGPRPYVVSRAARTCTGCTDDGSTSWLLKLRARAARHAK